MHDDSALQKLTPEEQAQYDVAYAASLAGAADRLHAAWNDLWDAIRAALPAWLRARMPNDG